jgi:hypothetical protein
MANTTSAKKATRKIARRTIINKSPHPDARRGRIVEEAIKSGDRDAALKAMTRGTGTHAGRPAQHHPQEQCQPRSRGSRIKSPNSRNKITDRKIFVRKPGALPGFFFRPHCSADFGVRICGPLFSDGILPYVGGGLMKPASY